MELRWPPPSLVGTEIAMREAPDGYTLLLAAGALEPAPTTPEAFRKKIAGELQRWARVVKDAGIKQE